MVSIMDVTVIKLLLMILWLSLAILGNSAAQASCRQVGDVQSVNISDVNLRALAAMGFDRARVFELLRATSIPETQGCWGSATGNFDGQIVSAGVLQWNYGQNTLQDLIRAFRGKFATQAEFDQALALLAPTHGSLIFSAPCTQRPIAPQCRRTILGLQSGGRLDPVLASEFEALFNSDTMLQIQVDDFLTRLTSLRAQLAAIFPAEPTPLQIKWALDTQIQHGSFPAVANIREMRSRAARLNPAQKREALLSVLRWYDGLCGSVDQDGCRLDRAFNVQTWAARITGGVDEIQFDLLNLSFLRARVAGGDGGRYQANAFQRRATIIFGIGSLAGRRIGT